MTTRMSRCNRWLLAMLVALSVFGLRAAAQPVAAQTGGGDYEFAGGQSLSWDGDWEIDDELTYTEDGLESVTLTQGVSLFSVLGLPNAIDLDEARDIYLDSLIEEVGGATTIDRGSYGSVSYSLDLVSLEGFDFGIFTLFRAGSGSTPTFAYIFFSEEAAFASQFADAQDAFRLDGQPIYDGVDGAGLQVQLEAVDSETREVPDDSGDGSADEPDDETALDPSEDDPSDGEGAGGLKSGRGDAPTGDDADEDGAQTDAAYVSPQYGSELDWGSSWELDPESDPPTTSDTQLGVDSLALLPVDGGGFMSVTFIDADGIGVSDLVEVWESADFLADAAFSADAEVVLADSSRTVGSMVLRDFLDDGTELVVIREAYLDDNDVMVVVQLSTTPDSLEPVVASAQDEITLDGEPVLGFFSIDEISAEL